MLMLMLMLMRMIMLVIKYLLYKDVNDVVTTCSAASGSYVVAFGSQPRRSSSDAKQIERQTRLMRRSCVA